MTIGTQDGEVLAYLAEFGLWLPTRLKSAFHIASVIHLADGLAIPIPGLKTGESCQFHFVVAWSPPRIDDNVATWLAVDWRTESILEHIGL